MIIIIIIIIIIETFVTRLLQLKKRTQALHMPQIALGELTALLPEPRS